MVTFVIFSVPIACLNALSETAALTLLRGADYLAVIGKPQREAWAMLLLNRVGRQGTRHA